MANPALIKLIVIELIVCKSVNNSCRVSSWTSICYKGIVFVVLTMPPDSQQNPRSTDWLSVDKEQCLQSKFACDQQVTSTQSSHFSNSLQKINACANNSEPRRRTIGEESRSTTTSNSKQYQPKAIKHCTCLPCLATFVPLFAPEESFQQCE